MFDVLEVCAACSLSLTHGIAKPCMRQTRCTLPRKERVVARKAHVRRKKMFYGIEQLMRQNGAEGSKRHTKVKSPFRTPEPRLT